MLGRQTGCDGLDSVLLLISEVVANALPHCHSTVDLVLQVNGDQVRVEVWDEAGELAPVRRDALPDDERGRGMLMVEALSSQWGVIHSGPRKAVWFEVPLSGKATSRSTN
ncbi:MAG: ATP-binding protein [Actinomycetota bacterium]|nr:ATP-binding protein [Actinomycetota bacterium]